MDFNVLELDIENKKRNLNVKASGVVSSTKYFPVFEKEGKEIIFKPLSKTKPYATPLFLYSEVYWSHLLKKYIDPKTPLYKLAVCKGISKEQEKYYDIGVVVENVLNKDEKFINLLEIFKKYPEDSVSIDEYVNYCEKQYSYVEILKSDFFNINKGLAVKLVEQILCSMLRRDENYHYENISFIIKNEKMVDIAPMLDFEFSEMFMYPDMLKKHKERFSMYDQQLVSTVDFDVNLTKEENIKHSETMKKITKAFHQYDPYDFINIKRNIKSISKYYPEVLKKFKEKIKQMKEEVENTNIIFSNKIIKPFSSVDWEVGYLLYKEGKNKDSIECLNAIKNAKETQYNLDAEEFNQRLKTEVLWNIKKLENCINFVLGKIKIVDSQSKSLYGTCYPEILTTAISSEVMTLDSSSEKVLEPVKRIIK